MPGTIQRTSGSSRIRRDQVRRIFSGRLGPEEIRADSATKIAAVRTALGFVLEPPATFLGLFLGSAVIFRSRYSPFQDAVTCGVLFFARIFIWALLLFLFTKKAPLPKSSLWLYALLGAMISSLLDWPGYALATHAPGQLVFC